jgi:hypothetical protein
MAAITHLIAMAHVADVERSIRFYELLGFQAAGKHTNDGTLVWATVRSADAWLMFSRATAPVIPEQQAVLFYLYAEGLVALRQSLIGSGVAVSEITYPFFMQKGEMRVQDPDGYCLLIGQAG